jgi:hypothetical protein
MDGTTDTTRTLVSLSVGLSYSSVAKPDLTFDHQQHFGTPTKEEIRAFTRVLQGHIGKLFENHTEMGLHC